MKKKSVCILLIFAAVIVLTYVTGESITEAQDNVRIILWNMELTEND